MRGRRVSEARALASLFGCESEEGLTGAMVLADGLRDLKALRLVVSAGLGVKKPQTWL